MSDKIKKLYISGKEFLFLPLIALLLSGFTRNQCFWTG